MKQPLLIALVMGCAIMSSAHAARKCLYIESMGTLSDYDAATGETTTEWSCLGGTSYSSALDDEIFAAKDADDYKYVCFEYQSELKPSGALKYFTYCTNFQYYCGYWQYLSPDGGKCLSCTDPNANGTYRGGYHRNHACYYCKNVGYYYDEDAGKCKQCPDGGTTEDAGWYEIGDCYVMGGSDKTGRYEFNSECWYSE